MGAVVYRFSRTNNNKVIENILTIENPGNSFSPLSSNVAMHTKGGAKRRNFA